MKRTRVLLKVKRFKQRPAECAIGAVAALGNFYNAEIDYKQVRALAYEMFPEMKGVGLYTAEQAQLLNRLGFAKVTVVTADLKLVDFSWQSLSKRGLVGKLKKARDYHRRRKQDDSASADCYESAAATLKWLQTPNTDNELIIDYEFPKYIRKHLDAGHPVGAVFNWTSLFKRSKGNPRNGEDIWGWPEQHAIVIRGYDDKHVYITDSHHQFYRGKLKKYAKGYYKITWENFLVNVPAGDLLLINQE